MKKNKTLLLMILAFALLLGGAYVLYDKLSRRSEERRVGKECS